MKKRIVSLLMLVTLIFTCACGGNTEAADTPEVNQQEEENNKDEVSEKQEIEVVESEKEEDSLLPNTYKVPGWDIYVNAPGMHPIESGFTQIWYEDEVKYATFSCIQVASAADEKEAFDIVFERFIRNMDGYDTINEMGELTEEYLEINGIKVYSFEGTMDCGTAKHYTSYVKGYSFVYEGMPCAIIGAVKDREQPQEQIDAIKEIVDAMILTVRSEQ